MDTYPIVIETSRLIVAKTKKDDAPALNNAINDSFEALNAWLNWATHKPTISETQEWLEQAEQLWAGKKQLCFHIFDKQSNKLIGACSFHHIDWKNQIMQIGYWLRSDATGKGFATEVVTALTNYAFDHLGAKTIEIRCDERNSKSRAVAQRAGYVLKTVLKNNEKEARSEQLRNTVVYERVLI